VRHNKERPLEVLVAACLDDEECRFDVLELKTTGDLLSELALCDELLDATAPYCREHAAIRWIAAPTEIEAVLAEERWSEDLGRALGHHHACDEGPPCETLPLPKQAGCSALVDEVAADPSICAR